MTRRQKNASTGRLSKLSAGHIPMSSLVQTLAVAEHLSFSQAAKALNISQSSVSARIQALESQLGTSLFERNTRGVKLTEAGKSFVELVSASIDQLDHAIKTAGMAARGECGQLRIGVHALTPCSFLSELIERYRTAYPGVSVDIMEGAARDLVMHLRADQLDIAFVLGLPNLPDCHAQRLWTEMLMAALPNRHPLAEHSAVTWAELAGATFLVRRGGTGPQIYEHILRRLAGCWPAPSIQRLDIGRGTLLSMIGQGFGFTIVGTARSSLPVLGVAFLHISDELEPMDFSGVWLPHNRSPALQNLLSLARWMRRTVEETHPA